jgi:hypothetical protein
MIPTGEDMRTIQKPVRKIRRGITIQHARRSIVLLIALALTVINTSGDSVVATSTAAQPTVMLQTPAAPMLAGTFQVVNNGPGDQMDPEAAMRWYGKTMKISHAKAQSATAFLRAFFAPLREKNFPTEIPQMRLSTFRQS